MRFLIALLLLSVTVVCNGATWYAATNGLPGNTGAIGSPWDLESALKDKVGTIVGGDTLYLRGGTYAATNTVAQRFRVLIAGTSSAQILIRSYPGEWAKLDGALDGGDVVMFLSSYVTLQGVEIFVSNTESRYSGNNDSFAADIHRPGGVDFYGVQGCKLINCVIHDTSTGVGMWTQALTCESYGNILGNNGWHGTTTEHGHNFYCQHTFTGAGLMTVSNNISVGSFDCGIQLYGSSAAEGSRGRIAGNIWIGKQGYHGRVLIGTRNGGSPNRWRDDQFVNNFGYGADAEFFYQADNSAYLDAIVTGNYFVNTEWHYSSWQTLIASNNTMFANGLSNNKVMTILTNATFIPWTLDRNTIYPMGLATPLGIEGLGFFTLAGFRAKSGYELNSVEIGGSPATNYPVLKPNLYDTNRAHLATYNWTGASFLAADVSSLNWGAGANVAVRNVQNYFVDVLNTVVTSTNTIVLDMRAASHSVAIPIGDTVEPFPTTFPAFGGFVFEKTGDAPAPSSTNFVTVVNSFNPDSGVTITVSPADIGGLANGVTSFTRTNMTNTVTSLTAPGSAGTHTFMSWQRDGFTYSTSPAITFTNVSNSTFAALYKTPTNLMTVTSVNPATGVVIDMSPADVYGNSLGTTPFTRVVESNTVTTLTAPLSSAIGTEFLQWNRNSVLFSTNMACSFTNSANTSMEAQFTNGPASPPASGSGYVVGRRGARL